MAGVYLGVPFFARGRIETLSSTSVRKPKVKARANEIILINRYTTEWLLNASGFFALEFHRSKAEQPFGQIKLLLDLNQDIIKNGTENARI